MKQLIVAPVHRGAPAVEEFVGRTGASVQDSRIYWKLNYFSKGNSGGQGCTSRGPITPSWFTGPPWTVGRREQRAHQSVSSPVLQ
jgi:hypothetical protein